MIENIGERASRPESGHDPAGEALQESAAYDVLNRQLTQLRLLAGPLGATLGDELCDACSGQIQAGAVLRGGFRYCSLECARAAAVYSSVPGQYLG